MGNQTNVYIDTGKYNVSKINSRTKELAVTKYNLGDHIIMLLPITFYLSLDVEDKINLDNVTYIRSTFEVTSVVLLTDLNFGYRLKDIRYGITLDVTEHFIKKYFVTRLSKGD